MSNGNPQPAKRLEWGDVIGNETKGKTAEGWQGINNLQDLEAFQTNKGKDKVRIYKSHSTPLEK